MRLTGAQHLLALHLRAHGLPDPVVEYPFHPSRKWRFDLAWPDRMLAVEIEGGIFHKGIAAGGRACKLCGQPPRGAHGQGTGILRDMEKGNEAALLGWKVLRFTPAQVEKAEAVLVLRRVLDGGRIEPSGGRAA